MQTETARKKKHIDLDRFEPLICSSLVKLLGGQLPSHGIFAGPGVATLLLSLVWDTDIKVDRIDHYSDCLDEPQEEYNPIISSKPTLNDDIYPPILQNGISIISSESTCILTRHIIEKQQPVFGSERTSLILYTLELNAFGVGFNCYSRKLHVTSEFEEFCHSRQLQIQSPADAESLALLFKYREMYGCFADIDEEIGLLAGFRRACELHRSNSLYNNRISGEAKSIFDRFRQEMEPYCSIVTESDQPALPGLENSLGVEYGLTFNYDRYLSKYDLEADMLLKSPEIELSSYSYAIYYRYCIRQSISASQNLRFQIALSRPITACMVMLNPLCINDCFTYKIANEIDSFHKAHPGCVRVLLKMNLSITGLAYAIRDIRSFANKFGDKIIGLIENHQRIGYCLKEISRQSLKQLLEAYRINAGVPLLEHLACLDAFEYRDCVTELTTTTELECEGWKMRHCVAGYAPLLQSDQGNTRIFHIEGIRPSTAAIHFHGETNELSYEVYGVCNCDPVPTHLIITEHLGRYLVKTLWKNDEMKTDDDMLHVESD